LFPEKLKDTDDAVPIRTALLSFRTSTLPAYKKVCGWVCEIDSVEINKNKIKTGIFLINIIYLLKYKYISQIYPNYILQKDTKMSKSNKKTPKSTSLNSPLFDILTKRLTFKN
jgi:hypothetical protein